MNRLFILGGLFLAVALTLSAQSTPENQSLSLAGVKEVSIFAPFSSVELVAGSGSEVQVTHTVNIEGKPEPLLRELSVNKEGGKLFIREIHPTAQDFNDRFPEGYNSHSGSHHYGHYNDEKRHQKTVSVESSLKLEIPAGVTVTVETEYGSIKAVDLPGLVSAKAEYGSVEIAYTGSVPASGLNFYSKYGAVDISIAANVDTGVDLKTKYGELFTDFDIDVDLDKSEQEDFLQHLVGKIGRGGKGITCTAPYGNVYLRKVK